MQRIVTGILAHVDAGKTTLTESLLYNSGMIRKMGRVDHGDAVLDTEPLEKKRGVTIVSKQAVIRKDDTQIILMDTPGHLDFISETERALAAVDFAIFLISAPDGLTENGRTLLRLLTEKNVPILVFVNKTDMENPGEEKILQALNREEGGFLSWKPDDTSFNENAALLSESEETVNTFLQTGVLPDEEILNLFRGRKLKPVLFGSALKMQGMDKLLDALLYFGKSVNQKSEELPFSGRVFKIAADGRERLTFCRVTGGTLHVRDTVENEKVTGIRLYAGENYESLQAAFPGDVVALTGLSRTRAGQGLGCEPDMPEARVLPVLRYILILPEGVSPRDFYLKIHPLQEEDPQLQITWNEKNGEIEFSVMGAFQLEILKETIQERFGVSCDFRDGGVIYKETVARPVYGVGHFEPLRHYAEIHVLIEPLPAGTGIEVGTDIPTDELRIGWQKAALSALTCEKLAGTTCGGELTDVRITLVAGRASVKHSDPGDFREAVRRAVRQGLLKAGCDVLEPFFSADIEVPKQAAGRVLNDFTEMGGSGAVISVNPERARISGEAPAVFLRNYQADLTSFTAGSGRIRLSFSGYRKMSRPVDEMFSYDPEGDLRNPGGSVFTIHGSSVTVPWYEAEQYMHVPLREDRYFEHVPVESIPDAATEKKKKHTVSGSIGTEEIDRILNAATHANAAEETKRERFLRIGRREKEGGRKADYTAGRKTVPEKRKKPRPKYLLVDGYNILYAWKKTRGLTDDNMDGARLMLLDILSNYRAVTDTEVIVVFDAYRVPNHVTEKLDYQNVHVVYTREAETADQYIARFSLERQNDADITIATSDGLVQLIIRGAGAKLLSAKEFEEEVERVEKNVMTDFQSRMGNQYK